MTWFIICGVTLLQICFVSSEAMISPPKNLTVRLVDFRATVWWLPGQGNPSDSRYTLEFTPVQNISGGKWNQSANCTNISVPQCSLTFDQQPDQLFWNYFVRVKTKFKGMSSNWTTTSFQPYGETCLSSPDVKISTDHYSIKIHFKHRLKLKHLELKPLEFLLYLFRNNSIGESQTVAEVLTSESPCVFRDVSPGHYCVNVSASHQQASRYKNFNTTKCIYLSDAPERFSVLRVCVVAMVLIAFLSGITLTTMCFYHMKPKLKNLPIPGALVVKNIGPNRILKIIPEEAQTIMLILPNTVLKTEDYFSRSEDYKDVSVMYLDRVCLTYPKSYPSSIANQEAIDDEQESADEAEMSDNLEYKLATDMEQSEGSLISEKSDDNMHSGAIMSLSTSTSNNSLSTLSEKLPSITVIKLSKKAIERDCTEEMSIEGQEYSQSSFYQSVLMEDDPLFPDFCPDSGYEPRSDLNVL